MGQVGLCVQKRGGGSLCDDYYQPTNRLHRDFLDNGFHVLFRSKSNEEDKARELYRIIRQRGPAAYDKFVEVLLESETTASLGEILKNKCKINNDKYGKHPSTLNCIHVA